MRCEGCGQVIPDHAAYCAYCGAKAAAGGIYAPVFRFNMSEDKAVTLKDLAYAIDRNWPASLVHLYTGDFANWLGSMGRGILADQAREIVRSYPDDRQLGLELFVRLVNDAAGADIPVASPALAPKRVSFGAVPRDNTAKTKLVITNAEDRGYLSGRVRVPPGVTWLSLASHEFAGPRTEITLTANTRDMPAGAQHRTRLMLTTPFETVETEVVMRVATEWSALLRAMVTWALIGSVGALVMSAMGLLLREVGPSIPWPAIYFILAAVSAVVIFGSIRTKDAALAIVVSILIGLAMLLPIGLGVLVIGSLLAVLGYQAAAIAVTADSTAAALAAMTGLGGALGGIVGLFAGLRRLRRSPTGCMLTAAFLALLVVVMATFGPSVVFGVFRPNQPLLEDLAIPVPYLAFAATVPAPGPTRPAEALMAPQSAATPTLTPTPTPVRRTVDEVLMLWEVAPVAEDKDAAGVESAGVVIYLDGVIDAVGRPHVAYIAQLGEAQGSGFALRYATWEDDSDEWVVATVTTGEALADVALALDADGRPHIAYTDEADNDVQVSLYLAAQDGESWRTSLVDGPGAGRTPALAFDPDGSPLIAYLGGEEGGLKLARFSDGDDEGWQIETVDADGDVGYCPSLALDGDGRPHVVYVDRENQALRYARYVPPVSFFFSIPTFTPTPGDDEAVGTPEASADGGPWQIETITSRRRRVGCDVALALDAPTGARHVLFYDTQAEHVFEAIYAPGAGQWHFNQIGAARPQDDGRVPLSLALDTRGHVQMTFNGPNSLRFVRETPGRALQSAVVDGPSPAQRVLLYGVAGSHVVYLLRGDVWYATLLQAPEVSAPTPTAVKPTIGASLTPHVTPTSSPTPFCGDGLCQEDVDACPADCRGAGWTCGNGLCEEPGEDAETCPADCVVIPGDAP